MEDCLPDGSDVIECMLTTIGWNNAERTVIVRSYQYYKLSTNKTAQLTIVITKVNMEQMIDRISDRNCATIIFLTDDTVDEGGYGVNEGLN
eukprot:scaffold21862_cov94-Skeletonema_dohrnii-CCMP3373.AAC.1